MLARMLPTQNQILQCSSADDGLHPLNQGSFKQVINV